MSLLSDAACPSSPLLLFECLSDPDLALQAFHEYHMSHQDSSMQPPSNHSPSIPIDPALALYPPYYSQQTYQAPPHLPQHLSLPPTYSSPSSQGSDTIGTPPTEPMYVANGKRPASSTVGDARKKARKDDIIEEHSPPADKDDGKAKSTRGSRSVLYSYIRTQLRD